MTRFKTAPITDVVPRRRGTEPSRRAQIRTQYQDALKNAVLDHHEALVVEMDANDKPLTIRNRIQRAAEALGVSDLRVRRRGNRIVAYREGDIPTG
ncbi:MAG TPA: hypothetical protein VFB58_14350 [Chloroflexota bacterium]|nr:hypothetical protein [Chloroflexota bacterium]